MSFQLICDCCGCNLSSVRCYSVPSGWVQITKPYEVNSIGSFAAYPKEICAVCFSDIDRFIAKLKAAKGDPA